MTNTEFQQIVNNAVDNKKVFGVVVCIRKNDDTFISSVGNLNVESQYFIASITKLYVTGLILKLREQAKINFDDKISKYLKQDIIQGLHIYKGVEYSNEITIKQLMAHTSGLPDYFQQKKESGKSLLGELTSGNDQQWNFEKVMIEVKKMKPKFKPGEKGKALYSDTNYQLLGKIIEHVTDKNLSENFTKYIFQPLDLTKTYLYQDSKDTIPAVMYFKNKQLNIPLAMTSFGPDGGIVSTARESMIFIRAFFNGQLFPKEYLSEIMKEWNKIFFPFQYGVGIAKFKLPRIFSPFKPVPELIGHGGLSGAFAYYLPGKDICLTGTVNQINNPGIPYKLMIKLINNL
jgi:CubicO group peptidase (beta-lactamase class C family)